MHVIVRNVREHFKVLLLLPVLLSAHRIQRAMKKFKILPIYTKYIPKESSSFLPRINRFSLLWRFFHCSLRALDSRNQSLRLHVYLVPVCVLIFIYKQYAKV